MLDFDPPVVGGLVRTWRCRHNLRQTVRRVRDLYMSGEPMVAYYLCTMQMHAAINECRSVPVVDAQGIYWMVQLVANEIHLLRAESWAKLCTLAARVATYEMLRHFAEYDVLAKRRPVQLDRDW